MEPNSRNAVSFKILVSGSVLLLATLVAVGWAFDIRFLKSIVPHYITMKANTALCFAMLAAALLAFPANRRQVQYYFGAAMIGGVAFLSAATLLQYLMQIDFGIDQMLVADPEGTSGNFPAGRLAPITAVNFILIAASMAFRFLPKKGFCLTSQFLVGFALIVSFQGLVGYAIGLTYLFGSAFYTQMALHTIVGFILLCAGILATQVNYGYARVFTSNLQSSRMARQMLVAIILSPIIVRWIAQIGVHNKLYDSDFGSLIQVMGNILIMGLMLIRTAMALFNAEQEREIARNNAEIANQAKTNFLANISHELRTPLGAVLGFSELLATDDPTPTERNKMTRSIKRNGDQLLRLIDDLLDISNIDSGHLKIERSKFKLKDFLDDLESVASLKSEAKRIEFETRLLTALPEEVYSDAARLRQVLLNVIGNAIKFNDVGGKIVFTVQFLPSTPAILRFTVRDTGPGISAEAASKLFVPFNQEDSSLTRKYGGTGLGLALSKKITEALGGDLVLVESVKGMGSTFAIEINPGELEDLKLADFSAKPKAVRGQEQALSDTLLKGARILLVEDSPDNQALVSRYLTAAGASVEIANDGLEGVAKALHGTFDLVLMDLQMPNLDGYSAVKRLRGIGYKVPILALTAHALREDRDQCLGSGFMEHLTKPVNKRLLLHTVEAYVTKVRH